MCLACAVTCTCSSSLSSTLSYGYANCLLVKSQLETSSFFSLSTCYFRYYSEEPTDTALRSPGSQHHQREGPAVCLLLLLLQQGNLGRTSIICWYFCINVSPSVSSFFLCYMIISRYLYNSRQGKQLSSIKRQ